MRTLFLCLREYPIVHLKALARLWNLDNPVDSKEELARQLADAMVVPGVVKPLLDNLSEDAISALAYVIAEGGAVRGYLITRQYGRIRPLGPNPMKRLAPWDNPENTTETLFYRGLIYRAFDALGDFRGEIVFVPPELAATLPPLEYTPPAFAITTTPEPDSVQSDGLVIDEDVLTLLVHLKNTEVRSKKGQLLNDQVFESVKHRLKGESSIERTRLLQRLLLWSKLTLTERGLLKPGTTAKQWLQSSPFERHRVLFETWRSDPKGHELADLPGLKWQPAGKLYDAPATRDRILGYISRCPKNQWTSLASFVDAVNQTDPDFLRPDGDYGTWYIRDVQRQHYLTGFESWNRVEGALIAHLIRRPLRWLGVTAIDESHSEPSTPAFRLTSLGLALLNLEDPPLILESALLFSIGTDLSIEVPNGATFYDRYQLERFSDWQGENAETITYRLTPESIRRGQIQGIEIRQMLAFLRRVSGKDIPKAVTESLRDWTKQFGNITLRRALLLQTDNSETLNQLIKHPKLKVFFSERLSPTMVSIESDDLDMIVGLLKSLGYWPLSDTTRSKKSPQSRK